MFSIINSILNISDGDDNSANVQNTIFTLLKNKNLKPIEVPSGISIIMNDDYTVIIPKNFNNQQYIQIRKQLKDKDGNSIECIYLYKFIDKNLKFINRIKILDISNLKCDENDSRIDLKLISEIDKLLLEIIKSYNETTKIIKKTKEFVGGNQDSISASDINDYKYLQEQSKYKNLKKMLNTSITEY
jgi:hypothetical protein